MGKIDKYNMGLEYITKYDFKNKEKNLNTAANVLAGGTTAASLSATIFNATQISAIKRAATVADECEGGAEIK